MARCFVHLRDRVGRTEDLLGPEIADLDEARSRAVKAARAIIRADLDRGIVDLTAGITATNVAKKFVLTLPFHERVELMPGRAGL
jgi:F420-0:gamma-glutamyl ligase